MDVVVAKSFFPFISFYLADFDGIGDGAVSEVFSIEIFTYAWGFASLLPYIVYIIIKDRFYFKFSNDVL